MLLLVYFSLKSGNKNFCCFNGVKNKRFKIFVLCFLWKISILLRTLNKRVHKSIHGVLSDQKKEKQHTRHAEGTKGQTGFRDTQKWVASSHLRMRDMDIKC